MRIATFNVENLRLRRRNGESRFDGARDDDAPGESGPAAEALDRVDRALTARAIADADADIIALQEVFDQATLDGFHDDFLAPLGARYPHRICSSGNDGRRRNVALLSRLPFDAIESHAQATFEDFGIEAPEGMNANMRLFRRDCLAARCAQIWIFVCHFKANDPDRPAAREVRRAEAAAVRAIIERRFADPAAALWMIVGDFNEHTQKDWGRPALGPLLEGFAVDLMTRIPTPGERWTYWQSGEGVFSRPDGFLASPGLAARCATSVPSIFRMGMARGPGDGPRYREVGERRPRASDHALVFVDLSV